MSGSSWGSRKGPEDEALQIGGQGKDNEAEGLQKPSRRTSPWFHPQHPVAKSPTLLVIVNGRFHVIFGALLTIEHDVRCEVFFATAKEVKTTNAA